MLFDVLGNVSARLAWLEHAVHVIADPTFDPRQIKAERE
jgi:hypothetical protein